uniref:transposase zinc-binding domain-containing protein n=1 Tax=Photobacterium marinum TaxID=1056511 RepID=UPI001E6512F5|nr:transposase zinc-binding domain-containing protein [Photobacterium marinum]
MLRQYRHELEEQYGARFSNDIRQTIDAMLHCKTEKQGLSQWYCAQCHHNDRLALYWGQGLTCD